MNEKQEKYLIIAKEHALSKNGLCLSNEYINAKTKLEWKCANKNHKSWLSSYDNTVRGEKWCPKCAIEIRANNQKLDGLNEANQIAKNNGGYCLSNEYVNANTKMKWLCIKHNHSWEAGLFTIKNGGWCPKCGREKTAQKLATKDGLIKAKEYAKSKGGECLSTEYVNAQSKMIWKCEENHVWEATISSVLGKSKTWCPQCSNYYYKEHKIRFLLNYLLETKFEKVKPKWNINPKTKKLLELDGYSKELQIAFEFQGLHHYKSGVFYNSTEDLDYIKYKDTIKKQNCINNNIKLLIIDDIFDINQEQEIVEYVLNLLKINGIKTKNNNLHEAILILKQHINQQKEFLIKAIEYAKSKGGECLSENYNNADTKLEWKCSNKNHKTWFAKYYHVINGSWCPQCAGQYTPEEGLKKAKEYAESKGGKCLSKKYENANKKLKWKCSDQNHKSWFARYSHVINGSWCPECSGQYTPEEGLKKAKEYAKSKGGECLSFEYINNQTKMEWKCSDQNHKSWLARYGDVANGTWCPSCAGQYSKEEGLKQAKKIAESKGGKCLSNEYINAQTKMTWKCSNAKHPTWNARFYSIKTQNTWCPECAKEKRKKK